MLRDALEDLRDFLGRHGEGRWAGTISAVLGREIDEAELAREVLGWETGLARLVLSPMHGHGVQVCAIDGTNRQLAALRQTLRTRAASVLAD